MSRILRADPYLTREDTGADKGRSPAVQHYEKQVGSDGSASNTVFTLSKPYVQGSNTLLVFMNGQKAELLATATDETSYEETSSSTVTFGASLLDTDVVEFMIVGTYFIQDTDIYVTKSLEKNANLIINGDMDIWQRGTSFAAAAHNSFSADRWVYSKTGAMVHTVSRDTGVKPTPTESGHKTNSSLKVDCTTIDASIAAGDYATLNYKVEGYDLAKVWTQYVTLSFWVRATKIGIYCLSFRPAGYDSTYIAEYTVNVTDTWEKKTVTLPLNDTIGTWSYTNGIGLHIAFCLASGSTYHGTADTWQAGGLLATSNQVNACDSTDNDFNISQVRLEAGQEATPFKARPYAQDLALCQRYYERHAYPGGNYRPMHAVGVQVTTTLAELLWKFAVTKRSDTTLSYSAAGDFAVRAAGTAYEVSNITGSGYPYGCTLNATHSTGGAAGAGAHLMTFTTGAGWIAADAEL